MSVKVISGSCLCGAVAYEITGPFKTFQYCHCSRCRKVSGSAFAANLFVPPEQFSWTRGKVKAGRYEHPDAKYFATTFCVQCGSSLPWAVQGGKNIVVPAGTLDDDPGIRPMWNVFRGSQACWFEGTGALPQYEGFPRKD